MNATTYRLKETPAGTLEPVSIWQDPDFRKFCMTIAGTALVMSLVACLNLSRDVNDLTKNKLPEVQSQLRVIGAEPFFAQL